MSYTDWALANTNAPAQIPAAGVQGALAGYQLGQTGAMYSALRGVDLGNPASVNSALQGLASIGMADQAKALSDLSVTRAANSAVAPRIGPLISSALGAAQTGLNAATDQTPNPQPPQDQGPQFQAAHQKILQDAAAATQDLLAIPDPTARATKAAAYKQQFAQEGVPQANIDEVLGDLSDQGLAAHSKFLQAAASGQSAEHPTGFAATNGLAGGPGYEQAAATLNGPLVSPIVQAAMSKYAGLDLGPGIGTALSITAPARGAAASAPYQPVTVEGPNGANRTLSAANFAAGQGEPGAQPIVGATPYQHASQTAAASAPYQPVTVTGPTGAPITESAEQFAAGRGAPASPGGVPGLANAPPITGPTPGTVTSQTAAASANTAAATAFEARAQDVPVRKANLANLRQTADEFASGPQSGFWKNVGSIAAEYGLPVPTAPPANAVAAQEEFDKLSTAVLASQRQAMGLPVTDQSVAITTGATPNERMTPKGITRVLGVMEGNEDYINAQRQAWQAWKNSPQVGGDYSTWAAFTPQWNKAFDPRVFQAQYMTPDEAAKVRQQVGPQRYDAMVAVAKRNGYFGQ